jgi:nucleotide-binding universal stress UspA family protein
MRYAAEVARAHNTPLIAVHAWQPAGTVERSSPSIALRRVWADMARQRLRGALDTAFGGLPAGVKVKSQTIRGEAGPSLVATACEDGDLLVIGTGRQSRLGRIAYARVSRYCLAHASCPVLAVPPSPLDREIGFGLRTWKFRRRVLHPADVAAPTRR